MNFWINLLRLLRLLHISAFFHLDSLLPASLPVWGHPVLWLFRCHPAWWFPARRGQPQERLRLACERMGPVFIKMGQLIATRRDLLPPSVLDELTGLQDRVRAFPVQQAIAIVEQELGRPLDELFMRFDREPLAAASIAQVHAAQLYDGREVIVKILRPGIHQAVEQDMQLLIWLSGQIEQHFSEARRLHIRHVVEDYRQTLLNECDLLREAANTRQLRQNFLDSPLLYVPWIEDRYTTKKIMVAERIYGVPVNQDGALQRAQINRKNLAETGLSVFFTQLLRDNFFHADMHPGNVWVELDNPEQPRYVALDCAIMGALRKRDQIAVARLGLALIQRDFSELVRVAWSQGWVPAGTELERLEDEVKDLVQPVLEQTIATLNFAPTLLGLLDLSRRYRLTIPTQFVLLLKTLIHVEGLGRGLYPDLDIWSLSRPLLSQWLAEQVGPQALWHQAKTTLPQWLTFLPELPYRLQDHLLLNQSLLQLQASQNEHLHQVATGLLRQTKMRKLMLAGLTWCLLGVCLHLGEAAIVAPLSLFLLLGILA